MATRLGIQLQEARLGGGLRQADLGARAGVAQSHVSRMERGLGQATSLETWASVAAAAGTQLAAFLEEMPGATRPRDYEHLKRQQLVVELAATGGWHASVERRLDPERRFDSEGRLGPALGPGRGRSVDVLLERPARREVAVVEVWDLFDDVGAACRGLDAKVALVPRDHAARELAGAAPWRVGGLMVVRATRRNRQLVRDFEAFFRAHFPAPSGAWLAALTNPDHAMPTDAGLVWTDVAGTRAFGWMPDPSGQARQARRAH